MRMNFALKWFSNILISMSFLLLKIKKNRTKHFFHRNVRNISHYIYIHLGIFALQLSTNMRNQYHINSKRLFSGILYMLNPASIYYRRSLIIVNFYNKKSISFFIKIYYFIGFNYYFFISYNVTESSKCFFFNIISGR